MGCTLAIRYKKYQKIYVIFRYVTYWHGRIEPERSCIFLNVFIQSFFSRVVKVGVVLFLSVHPAVLVNLADRPVSHRLDGRSCFVPMVTEGGTRLVMLCGH